MIRSQSISDMVEKRKTGLFTSLRSRKLSKDLNAAISGPRPLAQSSMSNKPNNPKRHSVMLGYSSLDKENIELAKIKETRRASVMLRPKTSPSPSSEKTLATLASGGLESLDAISMETLSLDLRAHPVADVKLETAEFSPFALKEFSSYLGDFVAEEKPSSPAKLHRTVNLHNMKEFIGKLDGLPVPMLNRKSLDFEANEIKQLQEKLSQQRDDVNIYLVENAMVMSFFQRAAHAAVNRDLRTWDEIDVDDTFKLDKYHADDNLYMTM